MNVYSRFGGKDGVIDELYADGYRRLVADIDAVPIHRRRRRRPDDDRPHISRRSPRANPTYYGIMFRSAVPGYTPVTGVGGGRPRRSRHASSRGSSSGQSSARSSAPDHCDPQEIAAWLWATCHGVVSLELDGIANEYVSWESIFVNGMRTAICGLHPSVAPTPIN